MMPAQITPGVDPWEQYCREALGEGYQPPPPFVIPLNPAIVIPIPESIEDRMELFAQLARIDDAKSDTEVVRAFFQTFMSEFDFARFWDAVAKRPPAVLTKLFEDLQGAIMPTVVGRGAGDVPGGTADSSDT
ncbi:hypothetical protein IU500_12430 [Nocardia terpenica]|uniref:hypothetical protein n=1 Tax=Nocardia terpenica TaxID=455432 RepID=UPI001895BEAC|nr:hypothetical protein [Nocardia terpenica]MBF6063016.1 hypothetical protein [Nocardia terpenica]MBF6104849.1 hypothetical protein [Nocardia terpenica]MBF6112714.1 hypothetical protein [Nocardia terpenica]MBF6118577.1 hypothetical protein [Nocardia terpenica]MBF6155056.1 hypothetical protein [Nocardia terpenica]